MYRYEKAVSSGATSATTPEEWAKNFAASKKVSARHLLRIAMTREARLIRRWVPAGSMILDAGCGFGEWVQYLRARGYRAIGLDYSPELIRRLRETYPEDEWVQSDIRFTPFGDDTVDAIVSWGVIEHDEAGPGAALREFHRILRPGGVAIVTVPVNSPAARRSGEVLDRVPGRDHAFFQYLMSPDELRGEVERAGFEVIESGSLPVAHIALVAPRLTLRIRNSRMFRFANFPVHLLLSWMERYRVMLYAVLRKPAR